MTNCPVMTWLESGVPITLLCDLVSLADPDSATINTVERPARDPIWIEVAEATATEAEIAEVADAEDWRAASA